ncbi:hypothetical protein Y032_1035g3457 [Ancylostoma ceylanicum]|uniref:Uncharacterized protein n=1 Tax=Ancylostoma ceylanicum TaxID=53326 RepID=A0A016W7D5_9BILA|nr:hypothetical protein Y032_1035g3457 [Ancylostoma ceylanicum]
MNMDTIHKLYDKETEAQGVSRADFVLRSLSGEQRKNTLVVVGHAITLAAAVTLGRRWSTASTTTPRNRAARAGINVVSRRSAISRRFSLRFGDVFPFFHVSSLEMV